MHLLAAAAPADPLDGQGVANLIAFVAFTLALMSYIYTSVREHRVEKSAAYLQLELASIEIFRFRSAHWDTIRWAEGKQVETNKCQDQLEEEADQFYYQCLNLFEVCSRFRHARIVTPDIYGSWVAWFYETLESPYFRKRWAAVYCDNYTTELRRVFEIGMALDWVSGDDLSRRQQFYQGVGRFLDCPIIRNWNVEAIGGGSPVSPGSLAP